MQRRRIPSVPRQAGFTLLEMIVVLVIIGLIMGLVGPRLFGQADKAKVQTAETQIKMLRGALSGLFGSSAAASEALELADVDPQARGEVLDVAAFARIAEQLPDPR